MAISKRRIKVKKDEAAKFVLVGTATFAVSLGVYYMLDTFKVSYNMAYVSAYISSTIFNFFASTLITFNARPTIGRAVTFSIGHMICLSIHLCLLNVIIFFNFPPKVAPLVVMVLAMPINFTMIRFALKHDFKKTYNNFCNFVVQCKKTY